MIKINEICPDFELYDYENKVFNKNNLFDKTTVLFFYPKNFTPGCTKEACSFRDNYSIFLELGCQVVGISGDSIDSHSKFQKKYNLPYPTYSDPKNSFRHALGLPSSLFGLIPGRTTLIFDKQTKLKGIFNSQLNTEGHIDYALKIVREIQ